MDPHEGDIPKVCSQLAKNTNFGHVVDQLAMCAKLLGGHSTERINNSLATVIPKEHCQCTINGSHLNARTSSYEGMTFSSSLFTNKHVWLGFSL